MTRYRAWQIAFVVKTSVMAVVLLAGCSSLAQVSVPQQEREPVVGLPCEGCGAVFAGLPEKPGSTSRIAPEGEPGEPMLIEGVVRDDQGRPVPGVIVYAYHTNASGIYPPDGSIKDRAASRHGRLRGWAETGDDGSYRFETIRPVGYPNSSAPAHVHMHVIEKGRCTYYIDDIIFDDDPRLTPQQRENMSRGRGGSGLVSPARDASGKWVVRRDIVLGENIPDYPPRPR